MFFLITRSKVIKPQSKKDYPYLLCGFIVLLRSREKNLISDYDFTSFSTASNAFGWFIARSASTFLLRAIFFLLSFPMNSE